MKQLKRLFTSGLFVLILYLAVIMTMLILIEPQPVRADMSSQPIVTTTNDNQYLRLTEARPPRDISKQRFAPLEVIR